MTTKLPQRLRSLRIDRLLSFAVTVDAGGFSAAAEQLGYPQPQVSRHVAELERMFGVELIDRRVRPLQATDDGLELLAASRLVLDELTRISDSLTAGLVSVTVGMYPSAAAVVFPRLLKATTQAVSNPRVELELLEAMPLELGKALIERAADIIIQPASVPAGDAVPERLLWTEPLVAVVREDDPLTRHGHSMSITELRDREIISMGSSLTPDAQTPHEMNQLFAQAGFRPAIAFRTDAPQTLVSMVAAGAGVAISNALALRVVNVAGLRLIRLQEPYCIRHVMARWSPSGKQLSRSQSVVLSVLNDLAPSIEELANTV